MKTLKAVWTSVQCCLNWKVLTVFAAIGAGILLLQPRALGAVLPLLAVLVCPLSMGIMMWRMRGSQQGGSAELTVSREEQLKVLRDEIVALRRPAIPAAKDNQIGSAESRTSSVATSVPAVRSPAPTIAQRGGFNSSS